MRVSEGRSSEGKADMAESNYDSGDIELHPTVPVPSQPPAVDQSQVPAQPAPAVPQPMRRAPVNYQPAEAGWWLATDGLWYPPEASPDQQPQQEPAITNPQSGSQNVVVHVAAPQAPQYGHFVTGPPKSKVVAGILQLLLPGLGIGRFYLGHAGLGIGQLLVFLFTCAVGGVIWGFIDGIYILCGGVKTDGRGVPLN